MSDEVKRKKVNVEVDVVELKIQLDADFFDNMEKAKKQVADKRGYDVSYGEYIQEAMNDLVKMVEEYSSKLIQASEIIKEQDEALGASEVVEPVDPDGKPAEVPDELYAHIVKDENMRTMYH